jgi:hypothetical protein
MALVGECVPQQPDLVEGVTVEEQKERLVMGQPAGAARGFLRGAGDAAAGACEHVVGGHAEAIVAHNHPEGDVVGVGRICVNGAEGSRVRRKPRVT